MSRLLRSFLFVPGDNELLLGKVLAAGADAVVVDLEDAVRPERKPDARLATARFLQANIHVDTPIYVRINPIDSPLWKDDLAALQPALPDGIRLAKATSADQLAELEDELSRLERKAAKPEGSTRIVPTIESAWGVLAALEIAQCPRVEALCFGMTDFLADVHAESDPDLTASLYALSHLVLCSRAAGLLPPIASVHTQLDDPAGLASSSRTYRRLGFFGRSCIHPKQLPAVHEAFTPTPDEVDRARVTVADFERHAEQGTGAALSQGAFLDEAVVRHARDVLRLAAQLESHSEPNNQ